MLSDLSQIYFGTKKLVSFHGRHGSSFSIHFFSNPACFVAISDIFSLTTLSPTSTHLLPPTTERVEMEGDLTETMVFYFFYFFEDQKKGGRIFCAENSCAYVLRGF